MCTAGQVCCDVQEDGSCPDSALFDIEAWVTTRGYYFGGASNQDANDGAVIVVKPAAKESLTPVPLKLKTYNGGSVPSLTIQTDGFPCEDTRTCAGVDGTPTPEVGCDDSFTCRQVGGACES